MKEIPAQELKDLFAPPEGTIKLIYGRVRQGKSTFAVRQMFSDLKNGIVVYSNIMLDLSGVEFDDRNYFWFKLRGLLPGKSEFFVFDKSNFRFFDPLTGMCNGQKVFNPRDKESEIRWLNSLLDCSVYYDEGQWLLDSYEKTNASVETRKFVTETGHLGRTIYIIAQRTQSVHVNARGNVNQFYRCRKIRYLLFWEKLCVEEFQDMKGSDVDEEAEPVSVQQFFNSKRIWSLFNTHYLRAGRQVPHEVVFKVFQLSYWERVCLLFGFRRALKSAPIKHDTAVSRAGFPSLKGRASILDIRPYKSVQDVIEANGGFERYAMDYMKRQGKEVERLDT